MFDGGPKVRGFNCQVFGFVLKAQQASIQLPKGSVVDDIGVVGGFSLVRANFDKMFGQCLG